MIPPRGVKTIALETIQSFKVGYSRVTQNTRRGNHKVEDFLRPLFRFQPPHRCFICNVAHSGVKLNNRHHIIFACHMLNVSLNFRPIGKPVRPIWIGLKGIGVPMRGNITRQTRIGIIAPRAAHLVVFFVHCEIGISGLPQLDHRPNARQASTNNGNARGAPCGGPSL